MLIKQGEDSSTELSSLRFFVGVEVLNIFLDNIKNFACIYEIMHYKQHLFRLNENYSGL